MWRSVALVAACAVVITSCADESTLDDGSATAIALCDALREHDNEMVSAVNASVAGINAVAPDDRMASVLAGMDDVRAVLVDWSERAGELDLPASDHDDVIREQLVAGAEEGIEEIDRQRAEFAAGPAVVPDDEVQGVVGIWFNAVEKVMSVLEPEIVRLDDAPFEQAILDEPTCRNVIQPYRVD